MSRPARNSIKKTSRPAKDRTGISLPEELLKAGKARAHSFGRSFSGHLCELIRADLEAAKAN